MKLAQCIGLLSRKAEPERHDLCLSQDTTLQSLPLSELAALILSVNKAIAICVIQPDFLKFKLALPQ
jgi:hypothetical protein